VCSSAAAILEQDVLAPLGCDVDGRELSCEAPLNASNVGFEDPNEGPLSSCCDGLSWRSRLKGRVSSVLVATASGQDALSTSGCDVAERPESCEPFLSALHSGSEDSNGEGVSSCSGGRSSWPSWEGMV